MIKFFKKKANKNISDNKKVTENQPAPKIDEALLQNKIKELADKFLNSSFLKLPKKFLDLVFLSVFFFLNPGHQ